MEKSELNKDFHVFGNKGACWSAEIHIAKTGFGATTLCGTPMLSRNWAKIWERTDIGCQECINKYNEINN